MSPGHSVVWSSQLREVLFKPEGHNSLGSLVRMCEAKVAHLPLSSADFYMIGHRFWWHAPATTAEPSSINPADTQPIVHAVSAQSAKSVCTRPGRCMGLIAQSGSTYLQHGVSGGPSRCIDVWLPGKRLPAPDWSEQHRSGFPYYPDQDRS